MQHTSQSLSWRKTLLRRLVIPYLILAIIVILSECYTLRLMEKDAPSLLKIGDDEIIRIRSIHSMPSWRAGAGAAGIWSAMTLIAFCYARNDFADGAPWEYRFWIPTSSGLTMYIAVVVSQAYKLFKIKGDATERFGCHYASDTDTLFCTRVEAMCVLVPQYTSMTGDWIGKACLSARTANWSLHALGAFAAVVYGLSSTWRRSSAMRDRKLIEGILYKTFYKKETQTKEGDSAV